MHDRPELGGYFGSIFTAAMSTIQTNEIFQIIEVVLASISFVVSIAYTVYKWYLKAHEDGKITKDEVKDLVDDVKDEIDKHKKEE